MVCIQLEYVLLSMTVFLLLLTYNKEYIAKNFFPSSQKSPRPIIIQDQRPIVQENINYPRFINDPLIPPGRIGDYPRLSGLTGLATQDYGQFEKQGFLVSADSTTRIPLFGRSLHRGGSDYEYYVTLDGSANKIMLPNRKEIYANDSVTIPTLPGTYSAYIYSNLSY